VRSIARGLIMIAMTSSRLTSTRLLLVADARNRGPVAAKSPIRHYRLARLRVQGRNDATVARIHLDHHIN
jgi:hypothetical protein